MSTPNPVEPICPEDCSASFPKVNFSRCSPQTYTAQLNYLYFTNVGNSLLDANDVAEWGLRLSNTSTNADAIRTLFIIGSKPKPESTKIKISLGREIIGKKKHVVNFKIDEVNQENHDMVRQLECGGQYLGWYATEQLLWGGNTGIIGSIDVDEVIVDDSAQIITIEGTFSWESKFTPERIANPISA